MVERHVFNAPTSKQPVEKLANRHTVAAHVVAARGVRTRLAFPANYRWNKMPFNLCGSLSSWCGVQNDHLLHTRPLIGIKQQAQAAHLFPQQHTLSWHSVAAVASYCCCLPWRVEQISTIPIVRLRSPGRSVGGQRSWHGRLEWVTYPRHRRTIEARIGRCQDFMIATTEPDQPCQT